MPPPMPALPAAAIGGNMRRRESGVHALRFRAAGPRLCADQPGIAAMLRFGLALCALLLGCAPALAQGAAQTGSTSGTATAGANGVIGSFVTGNGVVTSSIATVT